MKDDRADCLDCLSGILAERAKITNPTNHRTTT